MAVCHEDSYIPLELNLNSELCLSSCTIYVTKANIAVTLAHFLWFLQNEENGLKEVKIVKSMGMLRALQVFKTLSQTLVHTDGNKLNDQ